MNQIKTLQEILNIVYLADKEITQGTALYVVQGLFDDLNVNGFIDFTTQYGGLITLILEAKRKDVAAVNIIRVRSVLEREVEKLKGEMLEVSKDDINAIDSTCEVVVPRNEKDCPIQNPCFGKEVQMQLNDMPKLKGIPKSANSLSGAERAKRAREKKKANNLVTINSTLTMSASMLYRQMLDSGYDLNAIIEMAHNQTPIGLKAI